MKYLLFILVCLSGLMAKAQNSIGYFRQGEKLFVQKDYYAATQYYESFLSVSKKGRASAQPFAVQKKLKGKNGLNPRQEAVYHLAECYRLQHNFLQAEKMYKQASAFPQKAYPESRYWLGKTQLANGHYEAAMESFDSFIKDYTQMGPILMDADRQLDNLRFIQGQLNKPDQQAFTLVRQVLPGVTSDYAIAVERNDTVIFTGIHTVTKLGKGKTPASVEYRNDLYEAAPKNGSDSQGLANARIIPGGSGMDSSTHNGLATFSRDGLRMFYTRWTRNNGVTHAAIWMRVKLDGAWSEPIMPGEPLNVKGYNSTQPFVTADGKYLLFASDRPGGMGKYDLWYAALDSNFQASYVTNLGEMINSPGDEGSPYYHQNSRTLVFSSNGRIGMGGFDVYYSHGFFNIARWGKPENPGIPINSSKDDSYFISTDEDNIWNTGWLSSDRDSSSCCLVLYSVLQDNMQFISGRVVDCGGRKVLKEVRLTVTDDRHPGVVLSKQQTDSLGQYSFQLKNISRYSIQADKEGYVSSLIPYVVHMRTTRDTVTNDEVCLHPVVVPPPAVTHSNILGNFLYKKSSLPASAYAIMDSLALVLKANPGWSLQVEGYTDGIGGDKYNIRLAQARVDGCIRYLVKKGVEPGRLHGKSFGKCCPIAPDMIDGKDNPAGRELNRRVEYKVLQ